jgi:uncharacterized protein involved in exopolysaccharide biosynthesis
MRQPIAVPTQSGEGVLPARGISSRALLHVLFKRKWLIILVFVVCAPAVTAVVIHFSAPRYEAYAQLLISPGEAQLPTESGAAVGPEERMARTLQLLTGPSLVEQVVQVVGSEVLYPDIAERGYDRETAHSAAVARLGKNLSAEGGGRSSIVFLGFQHQDPVIAARVPNLLAELYIDRYIGVEKNPKADAFFEEQLAVHRQKLTDSSSALEAFRSKYGISVSLAEERRLAFAELAASRTGLADAHSRQAELQGRIDEIGRKMTKDAVIPRSFYQIKERLAALEAEESELALRFMPEHPGLREVREQIKGLQEKLNSDGINSSYGSVKEQEELSVNLQIELSRAHGELQAALARQSTLSARVNDARARVESLENLDVELSQLQAQVKADEETHRLYLSKVQDLRMANLRDAEKLVGVRLIEQAQPPLAPLDSRMNIKIVVGLLVSALAAVGAAFLLQFTRGRIETEEDVERMLGLPVLGSIPVLPRR